MSRCVVVGLGNPLRGDDAAGLLAARRLRARLTDERLIGEVAVHLHEGEGDALLGLWEGADAALVLDAARTGAAPGTVRRLDVSRAPLAVLGGGAGHLVDLSGAIELARALGRLPERAVVLAIEGERFELGEELSPAVAGGLEGLLDAAVRELALLGAVG